MVDMGVGEQDAANGCAESFGSGQDVVCGVGEVGVDESEAVCFADEIAVDQADAGELVAVGGDRVVFMVSLMLRVYMKSPCDGSAVLT
jgi:hypothetical protein